MCTWSPELKKDTTAKTTATIEPCIGWLDENSMGNFIWWGRNHTFNREDVNLLKRIYLVEKISKFLAVSWDSPPSLEFPVNV